MSGEQKRKATENLEEATPTPKKVAEFAIETSEILLADDNYLGKLKEAWGTDYSDDNVSFSKDPFLHGECRRFLANESFLDEFLEKIDTFEFHEKASDLFQFRQSDDLKSFVDPHVYKIMEYLSEKMLPWMKSVTGLPLNGNIDLFLSDYRKNDFLLCHDDELDSRRIAFILYSSKEWKSEFGGNLDLFSATEEIHPKEVVKSVAPEFNKFVFFSVGATSFHQVSEVTEDGVKRIALSGWFYGDPVPRPKIDFPVDEGYPIQTSVADSVDMRKFCLEAYLDESTQQDINEQLSEESEVLIPGFLKDEMYKALCADIVEQDVNQKSFQKVGPPNISSFEEMCKGPPQRTLPTNNGPQSSKTSSSSSLFELQHFFHSQEFLQFLEKITEMPFTSSPELRGTSALRKFSKGSYSLLRSGGAKQTGESIRRRESTEDDEAEIEPNLVDVMFFVASKWDEDWGGLMVYSSEEGEQLITIPPEGNCLAIVVRNSSVNPYVNYVNCNAGDEVYFSYTMTFALDGNL